MSELLSDLGEREQQLIKLRYFENQTQTAIASRLGISQVQVSRLEKKIIGRLKKEIVRYE